jgi:hypothetical protein
MRFGITLTRSRSPRWIPFVTADEGLHLMLLVTLQQQQARFLRLLESGDKRMTVLRSAVGVEWIDHVPHACDIDGSDQCHPKRDSS